ncbi:MAG TPA: WecB/TagA/CpsF family glycosyltransferase [Coleofasciculaceae cyanobacterium]
MSTQTAIPTQNVINFSITALPFEKQIQTILAWANRRESRTVCVANVHMLMEAQDNLEMAHVLDKADLVAPDGMPLVWMMRLLGVNNQERVAGMDIFLSLCQNAQSSKVSVFFVGSITPILERMRRRLEQEFPNLEIAGMESLPFHPLTTTEDKALIQKINGSGAGLLFVSLGCPKQEHWIAQHKGRIQSVMIGLGGVFPVYAGIHKRAPRRVRELGLEWFYRLIQEPRRLWGRYYKTIPPFIWLAIKQLLTHACSSNVQKVAEQPD